MMQVTELFGSVFGRLQPRARGSAAALALIALYDELWSGVAVVAAPGVERAHGLEHAGYALWIFALPQLVAALLEGPASLAADGLARERILTVALGLLAVSLGVGALAQAPWSLSLALAVAGAASGVACSVAQVALIAAQPRRAASAMARWTAFAAAGDLIAPLAVAAVLAFGADHRAALFGIALLIALHALLVVRGARPDAAEAAVAAEAVEAADEVVPLREAWRLAVRKRRLWLYLAADASCCLLDEVLVALAALRLHDELAWSPAAAAASASAIALGGIGGALLMEKLLERVPAPRVLCGSALISLIALVWFVASTSDAHVLVALTLLGASSAAHHPLMRGAAYDEVPGRPGLVQALTTLFVPFDVGLPLAIGALAAWAGLGPALLALGAQSLMMLVVVIATRR